MAVYDEVVPDGFSVAPSQIIEGLFNKSLDDGFRAFAAMDAVRAQAGILADTVNFTDATIGAYGVVIAERLLIGLSQITNHEAQITISDTVSLLARVLPGLPVTLSETVTISLTQLVQHAIEVIEQLELEPVITPIAIYQKSISETVSLAASLANFFGIDIEETVTIAETFTGIAARSAVVAETVTIEETVSPQLVLRVTVEDTIEIEAADLINAIYSGTLADTIEITAAYLSPGDGMVTWAMNVRTGAVTEYSNYAFNSFARIGHKYLGASQDGLYELVGDDDDGTGIVAEIKSGFAQWAGTRLTILKGIYLGIRGEGDWVLKVITGEGNTTHYAVSTRDGRSTKVHIGKGLKTRYFAFELISDGQDFDFDTIEFIPLIADRRV